MHRIAIPVLKALTSVLNSAARWASSHPRAIVELATMIAAGIVVSAAVAIIYIIYIIHLISQLV
jgi:hypothetical protein